MNFWTDPEDFTKQKGWDMRFWLGVILVAVMGLGLSSKALASPSVCGELPALSSAPVSQKQIQTCHRETHGAWYDFVALMVCRDLRKFSRSGAKAHEITACLKDIARKQFNYSRAQKCKRKHASALKAKRCLLATEV